MQPSIEQCAITCEPCARLQCAVSGAPPCLAKDQDDGCPEAKVGLHALMRVILLEIVVMRLFPSAMILNLQSSILLLELTLAVRKWANAPTPEPDHWNPTVLRVLWVCTALTVTTALCTAVFLTQHFCLYRAFVLVQCLLHLPFFMLNIHKLQGVDGADPQSDECGPTPTVTTV
jgi:hypothetical protein